MYCTDWPYAVLHYRFWQEVMEYVILLQGGLMWCSVPIFSPLLAYWDLMESQTAEFAPAALHLRWTHCGIHPLCLHRDAGPVLPPVCGKGKWHQICLYSMNEWGSGIWSDAQDKGCLVRVSAELCPSYFHDWSADGGAPSWAGGLLFPERQPVLPMT